MYISDIFCFGFEKTGTDPEIFQRGGWGGKFWKKNVCLYMYQCVYT